MAYRKRFTRRFKRRTRNLIHNFTRWVAPDQMDTYHSPRLAFTTNDGVTRISTVAGAYSWAGLGFSFKFSDLQSYTDFTSLFDQYSIRGVLLVFQLITNPFGYNIAGAHSVAADANFFPRLTYVTDADDPSAPSGIEELRQYTNCKTRILRPDQPLKVFIKPRLSNMIYTGDADVLCKGLGRRKQWVDLSNADVPHFGFKSVFTTGGLSWENLSQQWIIQLEAKYYFKLRQPR